MRRCLPWALAALPPLALLGLYLCFTLDFPRLDQWEFALFLDKAMTGRLAFADFWAQHNEHRILFPRVIMLGLARLSHWDVRWELAANAALGTGLFAAYLAACPRDRWVPPFVALAAFSMAQWRNWMLGWQMQVFLSLLATVLMLHILAGDRRAWPRLAAGAALATVASLSFASGLLAWPLGLVMLVLRPAGEPRKARALVWCAAGALLCVAWFHGYESPPWHGDPAAGVRHPVALALYFFAYLGQPVVGFSLPLACGAGVVGIAHWLQYAARRPRAHPVLFALGLCAVLNALLTAAGRAGFGADQALSSRYVTLAVPLWVAVIALGARDVAPWRRRVAVTALAGMMAATSLYGAYRWTERYHAMAPARDALLRGEESPAFRFVYPPDPATVLDRRVLLEQHGLSIFHGAE